MPTHLRCPGLTHVLVGMPLQGQLAIGGFAVSFGCSQWEAQRLIVKGVPHVVQLPLQPLCLLEQISSGQHVEGEVEILRGIWDVQEATDGMGPCAQMNQFSGPKSPNSRAQQGSLHTEGNSRTQLTSFFLSYSFWRCLTFCSRLSMASMISTLAASTAVESPNKRSLVILGCESGQRQCFSRQRCQ